MKLYFAPGVCSLSPHIVLEEAGLTYTGIKTDIRAKTIEGGADYKKTNPLGYVPALETDDGTMITEGPVIVQYIADKAPAKGAEKSTEKAAEKAVEKSADKPPATKPGPGTFYIQVTSQIGRASCRERV